MNCSVCQSILESIWRKDKRVKVLQRPEKVPDLQRAVHKQMSANFIKRSQNVSADEVKQETVLLIWF